MHFETETCLGFTFTGYFRVKFFPSASITFCFYVSDVHDINHISNISQHRYLHTWRGLGVVWQQRWHAEWRSPELSGCLTVRPAWTCSFSSCLTLSCFFTHSSCLVHTVVHCTMNAIRLFSLVCPQLLSDISPCLSVYITITRRTRSNIPYYNSRDLSLVNEWEIYLSSNHYMHPVLYEIKGIQRNIIANQVSINQSNPRNTTERKDGKGV